MLMVVISFLNLQAISGWDTSNQSEAVLAESNEIPLDLLQYQQFNI